MTDHRSVKGTRDLLPPETAIWSAVEELAREVFALYGYREIRTPILEHTELFERTVGEATDIVSKEMYSFEDRKGRRLTLRPESTASVARAFIENGLQSWQQPVKLFYIGPHFRYERPQRGRYRQFHQIGAELLGDDTPLSDAEVVLMLVRFLARLGYEGLVVRLNSLGDPASREAYRRALRSYLEPRRGDLGEESRRRLEINPLRILDTKDPAERRLLADAPRLGDSLTEGAREHFGAVRELLDRFGVAYEVDERLVRGLDYYTQTVFEIASEELGAQDAIVGGGRYDDLLGSLGGPELPGIGFAIGEDRLVDTLPESFSGRVSHETPPLVIAVGEARPVDAFDLCEELRDDGLCCEVEVRERSLGSALKRADRQGVRQVLLLGDDELEAGEVTVKWMDSGEQERVPRSQVAAEVGAER